MPKFFLLMWHFCSTIWYGDSMIKCITVYANLTWTNNDSNYDNGSDNITVTNGGLLTVLKLLKQPHHFLDQGGGERIRIGLPQSSKWGLMFKHLQLQNKTGFRMLAG